MEDWQQCLAPECQTALLLARDTVARHGGYVITAEDFLLALLDAIPAITPFLVRQGVDLDELVRTIQGEQPVVAEVHNDGQLSSQLVYWLSRAREVTPAAWLEWPQLLKVLARDCERLQDRAYVAVLELVQRWPNEPIPAVPADAESVRPIMTDLPWQQLAEDVSVMLATSPNVLAWVHGPAGLGKTSWLQLLTNTPGLEAVMVNARSENDIRACQDRLLICQGAASQQSWPTLILDHTSPSDLLVLLVRTGSALADLLVQWRGPVLLASREQATDRRALRRIARLLGRDVQDYPAPSVSTAQHFAIVLAHQPAIEKRWGIHLSAEALEEAVAGTARHGLTPGSLLQWLKRAAARLDLFARRGSVEGQALSAQQKSLQSQSLLAMAREGDWPPVEPGIKGLEASLAKVDRVWERRYQAGTLRCLQTSDLLAEWPQLSLAEPTSPVHYVGHHEQPQGESTGAGPGNLHS